MTSGPQTFPSRFQVCLVGRRGADPPGLARSVGSDIIYSERRGQSQKPEEIYELIEALVPNGKPYSHTAIPSSLPRIKLQG